MLRNFTVGLLRQPQLFSGVDTITKLPCIQTVRWRKRRWAPKNASKIYYVRKPTPEDPVEKEELAWRFKQHRTAMRALTAYFKEEVATKNALLTSKVETDKVEQEFLELGKINEEWNLGTAKIRETRQAQLEAADEAKRQVELEVIQEQKLKELIEAQRIVQKEMENAKYFVDTDNLEEEIEKTLNVRTSYNFAIDLEGNRYIEKPDGSVVAETREAETVRQSMEEQSKEASKTV